MAITTITQVGAFTDDVADQINANFTDVSVASGITATAAEINDAAAVIAALPTANVASPAIWNDAGVLKVGTA